MFDLRVAVPPRLRTQVAETLRNAIVLGELAPGERMIERVLCERMGVSRTSLREAMRELENEGLLTNLPNRGLIVSVVDPKIAQEIFDVREALEALVCRLFCERATDEHIERCRAVNVELMAAYEAGAARELIAAKNRLYDVLIAGADNAEAERMLRSIHMRASQLRMISLSSGERRKASQEEIQLLIDSLLNRRGKDAERLARKHVQQAAKFAMSMIRRTGELS
ncbi:GntR family transcriptional regulator [Aquibium oceanicum]|uniref:GntR family transcriptional regulator n=1 Tax=Aquibium oceanicum TaxID=1670800 RepID=UPI000B3362EE|nr:GntR family transcriptional regulator [Aquibium oceanicum]